MRSLIDVFYYLPAYICRRKFLPLVRKKDFPLTEKYVYLSTASIGLTPQPVIEYLKEYIGSLLSGGTVFLDEKEEENTFENLRKTASDLFNCSPYEVAVFSSVTESLASIAWALPKGGEIISTSIEFPSVVYLWLRIAPDKKWTVRLVDPDPSLLIEEDAVMEAVNEKTRAIVISHVEFLTGQRFDLKKLASRVHVTGGILIIDGIQAAGHIPVDVKAFGADVYISGSYKWLLGPMGSAVTYIRKDLVDDLNPGIVGWRSMQDIWNLELKIPLKYAPGARRFEYGTSAYEAKVGMWKSIEYLDIR